jgi:AraC family transcriptional regulator
LALHKYDFYFGESGGCECQSPVRPGRVVLGGWPSRGTVYERGPVTIGYTRCRPKTEDAGPDVRSGAHTLTFPTRGVFRMHIGGPAGRVLTCDPNCAIFQNSGDVFRTSHPGAIGDETVFVAYHEDVVVDAVREHDPGVDQRRDAPFPFTASPSDPAAFLLMRSMFNEACRGQDADRALVEESAINVLRISVARAFEQAGSLIGPRRTTLRAHAEIAESAKAFMAMRCSERLTIEDVAKHVHVSPFHLCRLFRKHSGLPIHRYLNRLRLRIALDRLHERSSDLAALAMDLGFASHSHFCDAFRREYGVPPSAMRHRVADLRLIAGERKSA